MELLASLRKHLLESPLGLEADYLVTYARNGKIISHQGDRNLGFGIEYQAHIIVTDFALAPDVLFFVVLDWLRANQANHKTDTIQFDADIIDHQKADVELIITLEESVGAEAVADGIQLTHHGIKPIDIGRLPATEWSLYIQPDPDLVARWLETGE